MLSCAHKRTPLLPIAEWERTHTKDTIMSFLAMTQHLSYGDENMAFESVYAVVVDSLKTLGYDRPWIDDCFDESSKAFEGLKRDKYGVLDVTPILWNTHQRIMIHFAFCMGVVAQSVESSAILRKMAEKRKMAHPVSYLCGRVHGQLWSRKGYKPDLRYTRNKLKSKLIKFFLDEMFRWTWTDKVLWIFDFHDAIDLYQSLVAEFPNQIREWDEIFASLGERVDLNQELKI